MIFNKLIIQQDQVVEKVIASIDRGELLLLTYLSYHCFNTYISNQNYKKLLDNKFSIYQADLGIYFAIKFLLGGNIKRIDGTYLNKLILSELIKKRIALFIVGGNFSEDFILGECVTQKINLVGYKNGYFTENKSYEIIQEISKQDCQVYIIGMGVPQQEIFAEKLSKFAKNKVIICVGNFLEFYFGTKKRAPVFIRRIGLEWLFRLLTEPKRLWKRYLIGIPVFFYRIIKLKFQLLKGNQLKN